MNRKERRLKKYYNVVNRGHRISGRYALTVGRALKHNASMEADAPSYWLRAPIRVERAGKYRIFILEDENRFTLQRENYGRGQAYMPNHVTVSVTKQVYRSRLHDLHPRCRWVAV